MTKTCSLHLKKISTVVLSQELHKRRLAVGMSSHTNGLNLIAREWLEDSGWGTCLFRAGLTTIGCEESLLTRSFVKKSRYSHRVTLGTCLSI